MKAGVFINALKVLTDTPGQDVSLLSDGLRDAGVACNPSEVTPKEVAKYLIGLNQQITE